MSRVEARRLLRDILLAGAESDDEPSAGGLWKLTEQATESFDPESKLEQKFRAVLKERLHTIGATVKEAPGDSGVRLDINIGGRHWALEPQVHVANSKPDFRLRCDDPSVPKLAIFTDGWHYHASRLHNRLGDDANKRQVLRDHGYVVLALSWKDVDGDAEPPAWLEPKAMPAVMQQLNLRPDDAKLLGDGPLDFLVAWIQSADHQQLRRIGAAVPWVAAPCSQVRGSVPDETPLVTAALQVAADQALPSGKAAWAWRDGSCVMLSRLVSGAEHTETVLVLDDRDTELGLDHRRSWETWLRLSNLLGLCETGTTITVRTAVEAETVAVALPPASAPSEAPADLVADHRWGGLFEVAMEDEKQFLTELAAADAPPPALGEEIDGIPLPFTWDQQRLAAIDDVTEQERTDLEAAGWRVVAVDIDSVMHALKEV
ncbi:MAG TPA: hypothetical protein VFJ14_04120 [Nocardioidaceae bacterium]|nr:hypothetical protein [Nocardioidaceae bacterium]